MTTRVMTVEDRRLFRKARWRMTENFTLLIVVWAVWAWAAPTIGLWSVGLPIYGTLKGASTVRAWVTAELMLRDWRRGGDWRRWT